MTHSPAAQTARISTCGLTRAFQQLPKHLYRGTASRSAHAAGHRRLPPPADQVTLVTLADRDTFRANLPAGTNLGPVNDAIARGCSADWIRGHLGQW